MKAVVYHKYGSPDVLSIGEIEKPVPKENEILVNVKATTVTPVDAVFRGGKQFAARMFTGLAKPKNPVLGSELSGVVEAVGENIHDFNPGDEVYGAGPGHQEYVCLTSDSPLAIKPQHLTFEEAAAIPYGTLTALPFLRNTANIQCGQKVLVNGASGSIGTYAVQISKYYDTEVTGVCSRSNVEMVKSLGADRVIDYKGEDFTKTGETWDIIFDSVGKSSFSKAKKALTPNGIYMTTVLGLPILFQMLWTSSIGSKTANITFTGLRPPEDRYKDFQFITELVKKKAIRPVIDRTFKLEEITDATRYVEKGHKVGNVVITMP